MIAALDARVHWPGAGKAGGTDLDALLAINHSRKIQVLPRLNWVRLVKPAGCSGMCWIRQVVPGRLNCTLLSVRT
jgi:hypothetical protein